MKKINSSIIFCLLIIFFVSSFSLAAEYDFEGRTVEIQGWGVGDDIFEEGEAKEHLEEVESDFNVNIEFVEIEYHDIKDSLREDVIAGQADGIYTIPGDVADLVLEGFIHELDHLNLPENHWEHFAFNRDDLKIRGTQYIFNPASSASIQAIYGDYFYGITFQGIFYNKDMLEDNGVRDLNEIYQAGEWTWDTFIDIAEELTKDTSGDGEIDQYGIAESWGIFSPQQWLTANDAQILKEVDGEYVYNLDSQEAIETFEFLKTLWAEKELVYDEWGWIQESWATEEVAAMMPHQFWGFVDQADNVEFEAGFVPFPKGPNAEEHVAPSSDVRPNVIPITAQEDPEALVALHSALYRTTDEHYSFSEFEELLMQSYGEYAHSEQMLNNLMETLEMAYQPLYYQEEYLGFDLQWDLLEPILEEDESISGLVDSYKNSAQESINQMFEQD